MKRILAFLVMVAASLATPSRAEDDRILVFAAASLKGPLDDAAAAFRAETGIEVRISYAGSNALAKQIEAGAPADLFISADEAWMDYLSERNLIRPGSRIDLQSNELVLIAPASAASTPEIGPGFPLLAALQGGKLSMADPDSLPAGRYAKAALISLGVWDSVAGSVARAENVRAALVLVARGEAPLGIVYKTDALADAGVRIAGVFPPDTHPPIVYPIALTLRATDSSARFLAYLQADAATAIFARAGFGKPTS
jgi:molybdate transport system substrate-binding protein